VTRTTTKQHVRWVEFLTAVGNLDYVVTVEPNVIARLGHVVLSVLAPSTADLDDVPHQGFPFRRQIERRRFLWPNGDQAGP
jgi:hypothetical protein